MKTRLPAIHTQNAVLDRLISHLMARMLVTLAHGDAGVPGRHPLPHMSQEIIAEMVGTTRSRVNAFMCKFKKLGFIEDHDGELVVNGALLGIAEHSPREHVSHR